LLPVLLAEHDKYNYDIIVETTISAQESLSFLLLLKNKMEYENRNGL
jgi:hypothetical protein